MPKPGKKFKKAKDPAFFENADNFIAFDAKLVERLINALEIRGFTEGKKTKAGRTFQQEEWKAEALLTKTGLYLSASGEGIFEIGMFGDEEADEEIAKFDPQEGSWA